jgi:hypothetical protein
MHTKTFQTAISLSYLDISVVINIDCYDEYDGAAAGRLNYHTGYPKKMNAYQPVNQKHIIKHNATKGGAKWLRTT